MRSHRDCNTLNPPAIAAVSQPVQQFLITPPPSSPLPPLVSCRQYVQNRRKLEVRYKARLNTHSGDYAYTA